MNKLTGSNVFAATIRVADEKIEQFWTAFEKANKAGFFTAKIERTETRIVAVFGNVLVDAEHLREVPRFKKVTHTIAVTGTVPGIPGYEIVGRVDDREGSRMIFNFSDADVSAHRSGSLYCRHCQTGHHRMSTYIFRDIETRETFQVGNTCMGHYTGTSQDITQVLTRMFHICETFNGEASIGDGFGFSAANRVYHVETVLAQAIGVCKFHGEYRKVETAQIVRSMINGDITAESVFGMTMDDIISANLSDAKETIEHFRSQTAGADNDYLFNVQAIIEGEYVAAKRIGLVVSMAAQYMRNKKVVIEFNNEFFGDIGAKYTQIPVSVISIKKVETQFGITELVTLRTETGHKLKWWNNKCDTTEGNMIINFKVKEHDNNKHYGVSTTVFYVKPSK